MRRGVSHAAMVWVVLSLAACASVKSTSPQQQQILADKVSARLSAADKAQAQGKTDQAFDELDAAIKLDPASKLPWLKKAQIHFDARLYGQAITEAQEVLQRDTTDLTAKSILAVSGLRVSADALEQLRKANEVKGSTRSEAESVAQIIRDALGEPILLPPTAAGPALPADKADVKGKPLKSSTARAASVARAASGAASGPAIATSTVPKSAQAASPSGRSNPFGALQ